MVQRKADNHVDRKQSLIPIHDRKHPRLLKNGSSVTAKFQKCAWFNNTKFFASNWLFFRNVIIGHPANFGGRCGKMSYRLRLACLIAV